MDAQVRIVGARSYTVEAQRRTGQHDICLVHSTVLIALLIVLLSCRR